MLIRIVGNGFETFTNVTRGGYDDLMAALRDPARKDEWRTVKNTYEREESFRLGDVRAILVVAE